MFDIIINKQYIFHIFKIVFDYNYISYNFDL